MTPTTDQLKDLLDKVTQGRWAVKAWSRKMTITGNVHQVCDGGDFPAAFVPAWNNPEAGEVDGTDEAIANASLIALAPTLAAEVVRLREALTRRAIRDIERLVDWLDEDEDNAELLLASLTPEQISAARQALDATREK